MSALREHAVAYLAMRRSLGFELRSQGRMLLGFVAYCEARQLERVSTEATVAWATNPPKGGLGEVQQARRLMSVRIFARHMNAIDPRHEVPPEGILTRHACRVTPYPFSAAELSALCGACSVLQPAFRAATWRTFIGLLIVTGLRVSEACGLNRDDIDRESGAVRVLNTKFNKSRLVFLHPTTLQALREYEQLRDHHHPQPRTPAFLVNTRGDRIAASNTASTFATILAAAGIQPAPGQRRPRLHDIRHAFAVATLLGWYHDAADTQARLPLLSTWLGHVDPKSTYWYLQAVPELLTLAAQRLEPAHAGCGDDPSGTPT